MPFQFRRKIFDTEDWLCVSLNKSLKHDPVGQTALL